MATKKIIAEQVLRVVNSGPQTDDTKVTLEEVMHLVNFERDALIKKSVMEAALIGEHEIPSEFLRVETIAPSFDNRFNRYVLSFQHSPIFLPNDNAVYQVCPSKQHDTKTGGVGVDTRYVHISQTLDTNDSTESSVSISFSNGQTNRTDVIGNKLQFNFTFGFDSNSTRSYSIPFIYKGGDSKLTNRTMNPQILLASLETNSDFQDFLKTNKLKFSYDAHSLSPHVTTMTFTSSYGRFYWGEASSYNFDFISTATNGSVIDWKKDLGGATSGLVINSTYTNSGTKTYPGVSFGIKINYSNNKAIKDLEPDALGVKEKGSTTLVGVLELTSDEVKSFDNGGYGIIESDMLRKLWFLKFGSIFRQYGVLCSESNNPQEYGSEPSLRIKEEDALGGFDSVEFQNFSNTTGTIVNEEIDGYIPSKVNALEFKNRYTDCYLRMPNPGMTSRLYNDAVQLSGKRYWYRQDNKIYLYNLHDPFLARNTMEVWYIAETEAYGDTEPLPMPPEYVPEIVKNLIQTFTIMNQAKEDVINDNTDTV